MREDGLAGLAERIRHSGTRPVVLIDGRSGAGKTGLARRLAPLLAGPHAPAQLVSLDDLYPGWDGLEAGSRAVVADLLRPTAPGWRAWDWTAERAGEWHPIDPDRPLVIEGCGALTAASRARADLALWLRLDADERRRRALARDGDAYAAHWDRWATQEERMIEREHPESLADLVLDG